MIVPYIYHFLCDFLNPIASLVCVETLPTIAKGHHDAKMVSVWHHGRTGEFLSNHVAEGKQINVRSFDREGLRHLQCYTLVFVHSHMSPEKMLLRQPILLHVLPLLSSSPRQPNVYVCLLLVDMCFLSLPQSSDIVLDIQLFESF